MLLRASSEHAGETADLGNILGAGLERSRVEEAGLLIDYAEAFMAGDAGALERLSRRLRARLGEAALIDAAAVASVFNAVVRIADATGIPLEDYKRETSADFRDDLGISAFPHADVRS